MSESSLQESRTVEIPATGNASPLPNQDVDEMELNEEKFGKEHMVDHHHHERSTAEVYQTQFCARNFFDLVQTFENMTECPFCENIVYDNKDYLKAHIRSKHYRFAVFCLIDNEQVCIMPCRRDMCGVIQTQVSFSLNPKHRSHFHCPLCEKVYGRSSSMKHHLLRSPNSAPGHQNVVLLDTKKILLKEEEDLNGRYSAETSVNSFKDLKQDEKQITSEGEGGSADDIHNESHQVNTSNNLIVELVQNNPVQSSASENPLAVKANPKRLHPYSRSKYYKQIQQMTNQQEPGKLETGHNTLDILKSVVPEITVEDQLFAATLATEMRHLKSDKKLGFKIKVFNFLHEAMLEND